MPPASQERPHKWNKQERKQNRLVLRMLQGLHVVQPRAQLEHILDWGAGRVTETDNTTAINSFIQAPSLHLYKLLLLSPVCEGRPKAGRNNVFPLKRDAKHEEQLALAVKIIISLSARLFTAFGSETGMNTIWVLRVGSAEALKLAAAC